MKSFDSRTLVKHHLSEIRKIMEDEGDVNILNSIYMDTDIYDNEEWLYDDPLKERRIILHIDTGITSSIDGSVSVTEYYEKLSFFDKILLLLQCVVDIFRLERSTKSIILPNEQIQKLRLFLSNDGKISQGHI